MKATMTIHLVTMSAAALLTAATLLPSGGLAADLPVVTFPLTPEAMALSGNLLARAESVGAIATNPAALYVPGAEKGRRFQLGANSFSPDEADKNQARASTLQGGFTLQNENVSWGAGLYSNGQYVADGRLAASPGVTTVYEQSAITFGLAVPVKEVLSIGLTLDALDLVAESGDEEYDEDWGVSVGALLTPGSAQTEVWGHTLGMTLQVGVAWSDEVTASADEVSRTIGRRDLLVRPQTLRAGLEPAFFWLSGGLNTRLRFPVDFEQREYRSLNDFYQGAADQPFNVDRYSLGADWEFGTEGSPWTFALRAGTALEKADIPVFNEIKSVSVGMAVTYGAHSLALASQADDREGKQGSVAYQYWF